MYTALAAGVPWRDVGKMTVGDISLAAQVKQEQNKEYVQMLAWIVYNGAALTGIAVNNPKSFPKIEDAFPSLFEKKEQQDWWIMKQRVEDWAKAARQSNRFCPSLQND